MDILIYVASYLLLQLINVRKSFLFAFDDRNRTVFHEYQLQEVSTYLFLEKPDTPSQTIHYWQ